MAGPSRGFYSEYDPIIAAPAPSRERHRRRPRRPHLDELNSPSEIRLWLPDLQREIAFCRRQTEDPCQSAQRVAKFQRKLEKLRHYFQECCSKLRELDARYHEDLSLSSPSSSQGVSPRASQRASPRPSATSVPGGFRVDEISSCSSQDTSSDDYRLRQILAPLADLRLEDALTPNRSPSYSSGSSIEDLPGEHIHRETDANGETVPGSRRLRSSHSPSREFFGSADI